MRIVDSLVFGFACMVASGCAGATPSTPVNATPDGAVDAKTSAGHVAVDSAGVEAAKTDTSAADPPTTPTKTKPAGAPTLGLAADTDPPGAPALSDEDTAFSKKNCEPAFKRRTARIRVKHRAQLEAELHRAIKATKTDWKANAERCEKLVTADTNNYFARVREQPALMTLKMLMVNMSGAYRNNGKLCDSAAAVPAELEQLKSGPQKPSDTELQSAGWKCLRMPPGAASFQYEVEVDHDTKTFELIARGFSMPGNLTELFLRGEVKDGEVELRSDVYRRVPRRGSGRGL